MYHIHVLHSLLIHVAELQSVNLWRKNCLLKKVRILQTVNFNHFVRQQEQTRKWNKHTEQRQITSCWPLLWGGLKTFEPTGVGLGLAVRTITRTGESITWKGNKDSIFGLEIAWPKNELSYEMIKAFWMLTENHFRKM